jgi:hypothetical protein
MQVRGGNVSISGSGFDTTCANDVVKINSATAIPSSCSASLLNVQVPQLAGYEPNPGQVTVTTGTGVSNMVNFVVARQPGAFMEITSDIEGNVSNQICSGGTIQLTVCSGNCGSNSHYVANYKKADGTQIASIPFHKDNSRVSGVGGAGFSSCDVGVVLDGDTSASSSLLMGIQLLDFASTHGYVFGAYNFNWGLPIDPLTGQSKGSYQPRIFRSPDGTIFIVATASSIGPSQVTAAVSDEMNHATLDTSCQSQNLSDSFEASITSINPGPGNQVAIALAGTSCAPITIH